MREEPLSSFSPEDGLWPRVRCEFTTRDLVWLTGILESYAFEKPHKRYRFGGFGYFGDTHEGRVAMHIAEMWARELAGEAGLFNEGSDPRLSRAIYDAFLRLSPGDKAEVAEHYMEPEEREKPQIRYLLARPESPGPSDLELVVQVLEELQEDILARGGNGGRKTAPQKILEGLKPAAEALRPIVFSDTEKALIEAASQIRHCGDYGKLFWHVESGRACWVGGDADDPDQGYTDMDEIQCLLGSVEGVNEVSIRDEYDPCPHWREGDGQCEGWVVLPHQAKVPAAQA